MRWLGFLIDMLIPPQEMSHSEMADWIRKIVFLFTVLVAVLLVKTMLSYGWLETTYTFAVRSDVLQVVDKISSVELRVEGVQRDVQSVATKVARDRIDALRLKQCEAIRDGNIMATRYLVELVENALSDYEGLTGSAPRVALCEEMGVVIE